MPGTQKFQSSVGQLWVVTCGEKQLFQIACGIMEMGAGPLCSALIKFLRGLHMMYVQGDPKKCHIRILSSNLFKKSDFILPLGVLEPENQPLFICRSADLATLISPIQNQE